VSIIHCRYCDSDHGDLLLCRPAKRVLDALYARGQRFDMPTVEFPDPITGPAALGDGTVLCAQIVAKGGILPVAGIPRPVLILTGQDITGNVLPQWVVPGEGPDLRRIAALVHDMAEMAIRRASEAARSGSDG
jgi:hypothetical protein